MKRVSLFIFLLISLNAYTQLGFESYYSSEELLASLQRAKTVSEKLEANGILAVHHKWRFQDSLANKYFKEVNKIADESKDVRLIGRAIWWENYGESNIARAGKLLSYAKQHQLKKEEIAAHLFLAEFNIHHNLPESEKNALEANRLLDTWVKDTVEKDSMRLYVYKSLTHAYIHKRDGVKASENLLKLRDYAHQDKNIQLKLGAMSMLGEMYFEWPEQRKKATGWYQKIYDYFKKKNLTHELLNITYRLGMHYGNMSDTIRAKYYLDEAAKSNETINANPPDILWETNHRHQLGLITDKQYLQLLDNNYNGRLYLLPERTAEQKARFFITQKQWDSAFYYLSRYKEIVGDSVVNDEPGYHITLYRYYRGTKKYELAASEARYIEGLAKKDGDPIGLSRAYYILGQSYKNTGDYKSANEYLERYFNIKDSLDELSSNVEVAMMEMQKQEELQDAEQASIAYKNKTRSIGLLGGIALLLFAAILLLRNNRRKQKDKEKIEKAFVELKNTQQQLIQSEKMASLGELTAGIAHEIQNPLNFVNNFSDLNKELVDELKSELAAGNMQLAIEIADNISDNEQKISYHGKRADEIVKGMLQHSRTSTGQKELTDLNMLVDEYLRLAYHGLRAKDKTFNANFESNLDPSIGKITIIPQEIGRVVLNLINNAFYAVSDKKKIVTDNYVPTVMVKTRRSNGMVEVIVRDNGNGISQKVLDKIFQPFFTTKPAGQGTGLGLSLSYDIIKAHGGKLKVESNEGDFAEFIVSLPV